MPRVCEFYGVAIYMYFNDHEPAHFHAQYGEHEAVYAIETLEVLRGSLPRRAHALVVEWATVQRGHLKENWERAREQLPLTAIPPLD